jgi:16S rRNA processing protein RimM
VKEPEPGPSAYDPETVSLGVVGRPHGIHGELWLRPHNEQGHSFEGLRELWFYKAGVCTKREVLGLRPTPDGALVKLAGIGHREAAAALTLSEVRAPRAALPALAPGEYYVSDVPGCAVTHVDGRALGVVASTFWNGAQDVMVVVGAVVGPGGVPGLEERLIPLLPEFVVSVDAPGRKIVVRWDDLE